MKNIYSVAKESISRSTGSLSTEEVDQINQLFDETSSTESPERRGVTLKQIYEDVLERYPTSNPEIQNQHKCVVYTDPETKERVAIPAIRVDSKVGSSSSYVKVNPGTGDYVRVSRESNRYLYEPGNSWVEKKAGE